jgi:putative PIN family toxin of toxin-antitoxin system
MIGWDTVQGMGSGKVGEAVFVNRFVGGHKQPENQNFYSKSWIRQGTCGIIDDTMSDIVIDTNVFISALISRQGASFLLFTHIGTGKFDVCLSVPLVLEYEAVAKRHSGDRITLSSEQIDHVLDQLCAISKHHQVYYLWRPLLKDPMDDMVAELAIAASCEYIITHNMKDFAAVEPFGVKVITPQWFLREIGVLP